MKFKNHIQGLRAISVLSVLIYHLEFFFFNKQFFSGGFLGVDIFFVISGYLISSIIITDLNSNNFSFYKFYIRRAKRLLPGLFVLILFTLVLAILILDLKSFGEFIETIFSSGLFYSNFLFWTEDAYSAEPSRLKFLLHTWSLSIEEQFYIFFPLLLFFLSYKNKTNKIIVYIFLISLLTSTLLSIFLPSANFFLMPTRIWEFLIGTIVFLYQKNFREKLNNLNGYIINFIFLVLLIFLLLFKIDSYHPSIFTLIPLVIISILIIRDDDNTLTYKILSSGPFVFFGNISYSLYLWHFPIIVGLRYYNLENSFVYVGFSLILIFLLSIISYFLIENNLRKTSNKKFAIFMILISTLILTILLIFSKKIKTNEFFIGEKNYNIKFEKERRWNSYKNFCKNNVCSVNQNTTNNFRKILFVGDSLVPDAINLLKFNEQDKFLFIENTSGGCPPIKQLEKIPSFVPDRNNCIKINKLRFNPNFYDNIDIIIINNLMGWYTVNDLEKYIIFLKNIKKEKIVVIGNYLVLKKDILKTFTVRDAYLIDYDFKSNFKIQTKLLFDSELFELSKKYDFLYISFKNLCDNEGCKLFDDKGFPFTLDQFHLTHQFTQYASHKLGIRKKIIQFINN